MNDELDWVPLIARYQQPIYLGVTGNTIPFFTLIHKVTTDSRFRGKDSITNQIAIETSGRVYPKFCVLKK